MLQAAIYGERTTSATAPMHPPTHGFRLNLGGYTVLSDMSIPDL